MNRFKYSIIIPHKNTPSLLIRCVASIPKRDDLQIVIVDDNSDPSIVDFENFPIKNDERTVVIFDKSGKGAGRARNIGMENAAGEKFIFADADDFFNYCFNEVLDEYKDDTTDIVFFNASSCDSATYTDTPSRCIERKNLFEGYKNIPKLYEYYLRYECGAPWSKIIRKYFIEENHVTFQESTIYNDVRFSYMSGHFAKSIKVDQRAIYCVTYNPSSITYTLNDEKYITRMHILSEQILFCKKIRQNMPPCEFHPQTYLRNNLVDIYESSRKDLYNECLKIVDSYGIGKELRKAVKKRLLHIKVAVFIVSICKAPFKWIKYFK